MEIQTQTFQAERPGATIRGIEFRPEGRDLPVAIVCHGFLGTYESTRHYALWLARQGFAAYCFDFVGGDVASHSGGRLQDMTVLTEKADLYAVMDYVSALPYTDPGRMTLMGCSQGGFVCALAAAERPEAVSRLILLYPALCIPDNARAGRMLFYSFDPHNIPDALGDAPRVLGGDYVRAVIHMDAYEAIRGYPGPVLLIHGAEDPIVPVSYAHRAKAVYGDACTLRILPHAGHGFREQDDQIAFPMIREFLTAHDRR